METPTYASQVYAFLRRNYRISRNTRALWQFQQVAAGYSNPVIIPTTEEIVQSSDEIVLLSALDQNGEAIPPSSKIICTNSTRFSYHTTRYRFAFILDMTDSCASVSIDGGHIYLESLTNCLCLLLCSLAQKFSVPGCELKFEPEIDISVYVYFPLHRNPSHQVLVHGYRLTRSSLSSVCQSISANLKQAIELLQRDMNNRPVPSSQSILSTMDSDDNINAHLNSGCSKSESSCAIINMLSYGITALQLMPEESTAGLVIITDGILDVPHLSAFEAVMRQIRARIISCSFVQTGVINDQNSLKPTVVSLGHVPNEELLKFISLSTFGSLIHFNVDDVNLSSKLLKYFSSGDTETSITNKLLIGFQQELLSWGFHKAIAEQQNSNTTAQSPMCTQVMDSENYQPKSNPMTNLRISCKLVNQTVLQTSLDNVLSLRLREGYTIKRFQIHKDEIEVHLVLPWYYEIQIYYTARSVWPLQKSVRTDIRVFKEAPIYFLQDFNQLTQNPSIKTVNSTRNHLARRYNDVIQTVSIADRHLTLINTFSKNRAYYEIPELAKRGKPIFSISQNELHLTSQNAQDKDAQVFADFWRPIVVLDGSLWQRFMYTHNLTIVLVHDSSNAPFIVSGSHLSQPYSTQNFVVSFRSAKSDFESFLSEYFSFILLDGQAYIKFLMDSSENKVPYSFMLLRIMGQPPLLYLKIAFQANVSNVERHKIIEDFRSTLIRFRSRIRIKPGTINENNRKQQTSTPISNSSGRSSTVSSATSSSLRIPLLPCCVFLNKNIERLMLKPDPFPYEALGIQRVDDDGFQQKQQPESDSKRQALSKFFYIQTFFRWFESIKHTSNMAKRISEILIDTLIKRRLQEGFHFAMSHNGIFNMILEVTMNSANNQSSSDTDTYQLRPDVNFYPDGKTRTCLIQYRIYPVEFGRSTDTNFSRDNRSTSMRRSSSIHYDQPTSYYFLTQCWVEPQDGYVSTNFPELEFFNHCTYKQIVDKFEWLGEPVNHCFTRAVSISTFTKVKLNLKYLELTLDSA